ncbi:MAG: DEAD/DEAH box helicase [Armatimonadetes bacterium]|nr:DEAD/DEAH box helicase [Armatimonadota bacterium]
MLLRFHSDRPHQTRAVAAVVDLFLGQPPLETASPFAVSGSTAVIGNGLDLGPAELLANLRQVQCREGLPADSELRLLGEGKGGFPNFSVEMETGTGKTYVFLRTLSELYRAYRLRKFVIVVPSVAIREGVLKTVEVTRNHWMELYGYLPLRCRVYDSLRPATVRDFARSDGLELLVVTLDSFNKSINRIRRPTERLQGAAPLDLLQATRPILILDEPQNMESERSIAALSDLQPLLALRYSATHREPYNRVYRLSPAQAAREGLVKRIEIASIEHEGPKRGAWLRVERIRAGVRQVSAQVRLRVATEGGGCAERLVTIRAGDCLEALSGLAEYQGYRVEEIQPPQGLIRFGNGRSFHTGEEAGQSREAVFRAQIQTALEEHFEKQRRLLPAGIKVLTLFLLDRVASYAGPQPLVRRLFDDLYRGLAAGDGYWRDRPPAAVQAAYFAQRRERSGVVEWLDSRPAATREDEAAFQLIMRGRERLLSLEEPVAFLFSHSALREGWDNPNICQICTLAEARSEIRKRQEIGRGVRLLVNQRGEQVADPDLNVLTVIANASYESYVAGLQSELRDEGLEAADPPARSRSGSGPVPTATRRSPEAPVPPPEAGRTGERLLARVAARLRGEGRSEARLVLRRGLFVPGQVSEGSEAVRSLVQTDSPEPAPTLPELLTTLGALLRARSAGVRLTRRSLYAILELSGQADWASRDPYGFAQALVAAVLDEAGQ